MSKVFLSYVNFFQDLLTTLMILIMCLDSSWLLRFYIVFYIAMGIISWDVSFANVPDLFDGRPRPLQGVVMVFILWGLTPSGVHGVHGVHPAVFLLLEVHAILEATIVSWAGSRSRQSQPGKNLWHLMTGDVRTIANSFVLFCFHGFEASTSMCSIHSERLIDFRHWALFIVQGTSKGRPESWTRWVVDER
jgi:hypothetical protein